MNYYNNIILYNIINNDHKKKLLNLFIYKYKKYIKMKL